MTDLKQLRELAENATPGPWTILGNTSLVSEKTGGFVRMGGPTAVLAPNPDEDISYAAAANPKTMLDILDYVEKLEDGLKCYANGHKDPWYAKTILEKGIK